MEVLPCKTTNQEAGKRWADPEFLKAFPELAPTRYNMSHLPPSPYGTLSVDNRIFSSACQKGASLGKVIMLACCAKAINNLVAP